MRIRESDQLRTVLAMYEQEINQDRSRPSLSEVEDHGKEIYRSKDQSPKLLRPKTTEKKQEYW